MGTRGLQGWTAGCAALVLILAGCSGVSEQKPLRRTSGATELAGSGEEISAPAIAIDAAGTIHVAWVQGLASEAQVISQHLTEGGSWSDPQTLSRGEEFNEAPAFLTRPDGDLCAFWMAGKPVDALYMSCRKDADWSVPEVAVAPRGITATYAPGFSRVGEPLAAYGVPPSVIGFLDSLLTVGGVTADQPAFAVDAAGGLHVAWRQFANKTGEPEGMVHRYSIDGTSSWGKTAVLDEQGWSGHDLIADERGNVHWLALDGTYRRWTPSDGWEGPVELGGELGLVSGRLAVGEDGRARVVFATGNGAFSAEQLSDGTWKEVVMVKDTFGTAIDTAVVTVDDSGESHFAWITSEAGLYYLSG